MATRCFTPVLGKRLRVTALDSCGNPVTGTVPASGYQGSVAVTDGFVSVSLSAEVEDGSEIITKKADGSLCVNEMTANSFKRFTVEAEFCGVDPGVLSVVTNAEIYQNYDAIAAGIVVPEGTIRKQFALELWTGLSGEACGVSPQEASGYLLLPWVQSGVLADLSVDGENAVTFGLAGGYTNAPTPWGRGPYNVMYNSSLVKSKLPSSLDPLDHLLLVATNMAPPPSACGLVTFAAAVAQVA